MLKSQRIQVSLSEQDLKFLILKKAESGESFPQIIKNALHEYEEKHRVVKSHIVLPGKACQKCESNGYQKFSKSCINCEEVKHKFEYV